MVAIAWSEGEHGGLNIYHQCMGDGGLYSISTFRAGIHWGTHNGTLKCQWGPRTCDLCKDLGPHHKRAWAEVGQSPACGWCMETIDWSPFLTFLKENPKYDKRMPMRRLRGQDAGRKMETSGDQRV